MRIVFPDEKIFDLSNDYNSQKNRIKVVDRIEASWKDGSKQKRNFPKR